MCINFHTQTVARLSIGEFCAHSAHVCILHTCTRCTCTLEVKNVGNFEGIFKSFFKSEYFTLQVDPTYRSLLEETSVDYIQKFRELASQMNGDH